MRPAAKLLATLARAGGHVIARNGRLLYRGPANALTTEIADEISRQREDILVWLSLPLNDLPPDELIEFDFDPNVTVVVGGRHRSGAEGGLRHG